MRLPIWDHGSGKLGFHCGREEEPLSPISPCPYLDTWHWGLRVDGRAFDMGEELMHFGDEIAPIPMVGLDEVELQSACSINH